MRRASVKRANATRGRPRRARPRRASKSARRASAPPCSPSCSRDRRQTRSSRWRTPRPRPRPLRTWRALSRSVHLHGLHVDLKHGMRMGCSRPIIIIGLVPLQPPSPCSYPTIIS
jgi:hypothetical protein